MVRVDVLSQGYANADQEMGIILQSVLSKNYPKVRKGLYVFPINWFVQLFWDTLLKPLLATLQPDIEDKVSCVRVLGSGSGFRAEVFRAHFRFKQNMHLLWPLDMPLIGQWCVCVGEGVGPGRSVL